MSMATSGALAVWGRGGRYGPNWLAARRKAGSSVAWVDGSDEWHANAGRRWGMVRGRRRTLVYGGMMGTRYAAVA